MARKNRQESRKRRSQLRKTRKGGGWGFTGASSIPGVPGTVSNPQVFTGIGDCRATEPGYWIPWADYSKYFTGLPGMKGGKRKGRKMMYGGNNGMGMGMGMGMRSMSRKDRKGRKSRKMKGGRYTFDLSAGSVAGVSPNAAAWWAGTYAPVQRIACEGSTPNPLNPGPHTPSTQPLPVASSLLGGLNPQSGGAQNLAPATYGVGNVDSMYYYGPTAGYDNKPSTWVDSVGAPVQLQIPYAARAMNPACLTTGHPPPLTGALQKGGSVPSTGSSALDQIVKTVSDATQGTFGAAGGLVGSTAGAMVGAAQNLVPSGIAGIPQAVSGATTGLITGAAGAAQTAGSALASTASGIGSGAVAAVTPQKGGYNGKSRENVGMNTFRNGKNIGIAEEELTVTNPSTNTSVTVNATAVSTNSNKKSAVAQAAAAAKNAVSGAANAAAEAVKGAFGFGSTPVVGGGRRNRKNSRKNTRKNTRKNRKTNRKNRKNSRKNY